MKQPELGKKILELRKSKGFTQEELVEKCNINVRTIQRIEAGDVTPRSFTVKTILEALGVDTGIFFDSSIHEEEKVELSENDKTTLRVSWISGIFVAVFSSIGMIVELAATFSHNDGSMLIPTLLWSIPFLISLFFFLRGYHRAGKLFDNTTLVSATYIYFIMEVVITIITLGLVIYEVDEHSGVILPGIAIAMLFGISELILGIGILRLKDRFGSLAQVIGIVKVVLGVMLITVLLAPFAAFFVIPVLILEVILLYNILQKYTN